MNELWQRRRYPVIFQLSRGSKLDRVDLYGTFDNTRWTNPLVQLTYSHQKTSGEFVYSAIVDLIPGNYEYKYKINDKDWRINEHAKKNKENNIISKEDFIQIIIDYYENLETKKHDNQIRYHDVPLILYNEHIMSDIELIVNDNQHYKVHRAILAAGSDYFKNLFQSQSNDSNTKIVSLRANESEAFSWMLKFLYTGLIDKSILYFDQIESLLKLATTFQIATLLKALINLVTVKIDANNCLRLLFMEEYFGDQWTIIYKEAIKTAANSFFYICHQVEFAKLPFAILSDILNHNDILISNQTMFHSVLMRWSKNQTNSTDEDVLSEYRIPDLYQDSYRKCNEIYKVPSSIVCFLADGSERYTTMTVNAINSLVKSTPHVMIGLLLMNIEIKKMIFSQIDRDYHYRILCKQTSKTEIIKNWNPTQYKMDIIKFAYDGFQEIFWMDSDTMIYKDLTSALYAFCTSNQQFYFIPDHVMFDINFIKNWREEHSETLIPQACFMGFKSAVMPTFFNLWKQSWIKWIEPKPFTNYKDPNPTFIGSAFCTEQYALGNAVYQFISRRSSSNVLNENLLAKYINRIERTLTIINNGQPDQTQISQDKAKILNRTNTKLLSMTPLTSDSVYFYSCFGTCTIASEIVGSEQRVLQLRSFVEIKENLGSVNFTNIIDRFFDCLFHFYNHNYDVAYQWYIQNFN